MSLIVSSVICTHNRADYLFLALQSLVDQSMSKSQYEIIVIDNCSTDQTKEVVESFSKQQDQIRYIYESTLGLSYARNTALQNAKGKYIAYLDDDAIACPNWLNKIVSVFEETVVPQIGCAGGKVELIWEADRPSWLSDQLLHVLGFIDWSKTPRPLNLDSEWLVGASIAFSVDVLNSIGGFNLGLGRVGTNLLSNEEIMIEKKIVEIGYSCYYHPDISVGHHVTQSRLTQDWFTRRYYWQGVSNAVVYLIEQEPSNLSRFRDVFLEILRLFRYRKDITNMIFSTTDPSQFTQKCFSFIKLGYIVGLLTSKY
jgi:glucosyl-dolichyl phosphate glucuronosyltransferase